MGRIAGVVTGKVINVNDPEGYGRVQVSFPSMGGQNEGYWSPVATLMTGGGRGSWFMPVEGDDVLVAFDQEDVGSSYILGYLWNGQDKPPDTDPANRIIVTPGGHTLRFEDGDSKKVILKSNGGHTLEFDDSGPTVTLKSNGGQTITLNDSDGSITLRGGQRILAMSNGTVNIS